MGVDVETWYRRYGPMVLRRCRALLKDEERALEAMQDVFVEVVRRDGQLSVDAPSSFLYRTATNVCLNKIRSKKRKPAEPMTDVIELIATAPLAEDRAVVRGMLDAIFGREPVSTREMAVLHLVDGYTLEEVAEHVGMSVSGVRKRLRTLKARVPELLEASS